MSGTSVIIQSQSGTWSGRPSSPVTGQQYFATDLGTGGALLTWNGSRWTGIIQYVDGSTYAPGSTTANTIVRSIFIPAGLLAANSQIDVTAQFQLSSTVAPTLRAYFDTTASGTANNFALFSAVATNQQQASMFKTIVNRNSLSSQLIRMTTTGAFSNEATTSASLVTSAVNTANDSYINFAIQKGAAADVANLVMTKIIIYL